MLNVRQPGSTLLAAASHINKLALLPGAQDLCLKNDLTRPVRHFVSAPTSSKNVRNYSMKSYEEVMIPVSWGNISGKWWGNRNVTPLIGLHGFEDNAGSFDRIAPLLNVPSFLAWDAPGHGKSSKFPKGSSYSFVDFVLSLRQVVHHFGWKKISILAHSHGSVVGFVYAALYPNEVNCLIRVDCTSIIMYLALQGLSPLKKAFDNYIKCDSLSSEMPPAYTWEELLTAYCNAAHNSVSKDCAPHILERGVTKHPKFEDKYFFSRDPKLRFGEFGRFDISLMEECAQNVKCHVLTIFGTEGYLNIGSYKYKNLKDLHLKQDKILEKSAASFERQDLPGTHHLHLNNPEPVAIVINKFLSHYEKSSL